VEREAALKGDVEALQSTIRDLTQRLTAPKAKNRRVLTVLGRPHWPSSQAGATAREYGHGRSDRTALPVVTEVHDLSEAAQHCPACGKAFAPFPGAESSDVIEIQIQAHMRRIQRPRYHKTCQCPQVQVL